MQEPSEEADASVPAEPVPDGPPSSGGTVMLRRKAAKRSLPWDLVVDELELVPLPPQVEEIPARKKPRLEEPFSASTAPTDDAAAKTASPDVSVGLPLPAADEDDANANADPETDTQPNSVANWATGHWTTDEDAELTSAVAITSKKKWRNEYKTDWAAVAALVTGRTPRQCRDRWQLVLDPSIDRTPPGRTGQWVEDEDIKLKDGVERHGGNNWDAVAALVPGRTQKQCRNRWHYALKSSIDRTTGLAGKWAEDEDSKLKGAVQTYGGKNWNAIAALVPGRTYAQCSSRWLNLLDSSIDPATRRKGSWTKEEDDTLNDAVQTHGGKDWAAIIALVSARTEHQCRDRWNIQIGPNRIAVRVKGHSTIKKAPTLGQDTLSP
jgi:hypothetical protein